MNKTIQKLSPLTEASFYILLSLRQPLHGYGIIKNVEELTDGRLHLAAGTLYGALQNLQKYKCIDLVSVDESNKKKKEYVISELGTQLLEHEIDRLSKMIEHAKVMEGKP
jgi:DNA-binding PadR family transcriptional regulator